MVRANRYALAVSLKGEVLPGWERALHGCDVPLCVRVSEPGELGLRHVFAGSQRDNMEQMGPNMIATMLLAGTKHSSARHSTEVTTRRRAAR